ncbi:WD40-repeat-containing domain protein [Paraphysoderma sedebokerense]|nr:WD40-repeat-containing domain protein [Paraphysoderma sedebokerense]
MPAPQKKKSQSTMTAAKRKNAQSKPIPIAVHRTRILKPPAAPVSSIALTPASVFPPLLAVSRNVGVIDIYRWCPSHVPQSLNNLASRQQTKKNGSQDWMVSGKWSPLKTLTSSHAHQITCLKWVHHPHADSSSHDTSDSSSSDSEPDNIDSNVAKNNPKKSKRFLSKSERESLRSSNLTAMEDLEPLRLISSSLNGELCEWDLDTAVPSYTPPTTNHPMHHIDVHPSLPLVSVSSASAVLVFSMSNGTITPVMTIPSQSSKATPLCSLFVGDDMLVVGCADSTVRVYRLFFPGEENYYMGEGRARSECISRMTIRRHERKETRVWSLAQISSTTVSATTSLGTLEIFSLDSFTLTQTLQLSSMSHDLLSHVVSPDGSVIYAAGIDRRIFEIKLLAENKTESSGGSLKPRYVLSAHRTYHTHDILSLALLTQSHFPRRRYSSPIGIPPVTLISGGVDGQLTFCSVTKPTAVEDAGVPNASIYSFKSAIQYRLPSFPPLSQATTSISSDGLLLSGNPYEAHVTLYRLSQSSESLSNSAEQYDNLLRLTLDSPSPSGVTCCSISSCGKFMAFSDQYATRLFQLSFGSSSPAVTKLMLPAEIPASHRLAFTNTDKKKLVVYGVDRKIYISHIDESQGSVSVEDAFAADSHVVSTEKVQNSLEKGLTKFGLKTTCVGLTVSADDKFICWGMDNGSVGVWDMSKASSHIQPPMFNDLSHISFPSSTESSHVHTLLLTHPDNTFTLFNVQKAMYHPDTVELNHALSLDQKISEELYRRRDVISGGVWICQATSSKKKNRQKSDNGDAMDIDVSVSSLKPAKILLYGQNYLVNITLPSSQPKTSNSASNAQKRKQSEAENTLGSSTSNPNKSQSNSKNRTKSFAPRFVKLITRFSDITFMGHMLRHSKDGNHEMDLVINERPWVEVVTELPAVVWRKKFGV